MIGAYNTAELDFDESLGEMDEEDEEEGDGEEEEDEEEDE